MQATLFGTPATAAGSTVISSSNLPPTGRNRIINGDMRIDQRKEGASLACTAGSGYNKSADKWKLYTNPTGAFTIQRNSASPPAGFLNYLTATVTTPDAAPAATSNYNLGQPIEGLLLQDTQFGAAGAQAVSLSFWIRSSLTGQFGGALTNSATSRAYPFSFTINAANTWQQIQLIIPGDVTGTWLFTNGVGIYLWIDLGAGSNFLAAAGSWGATNSRGATGDVKLVATNGATLDLTGVQLEVSPFSTPFEYLPYGLQLLLCQRYYCKSFIAGTAPAQAVGINTGESWAISGKAASGTGYIFVQFPVTMRAAPGTVVTYNPASANAQIRDESAAADCSATASGGGPGDTHMILYCTVAGATSVGSQLGVHWTADADL